MNQNNSINSNFQENVSKAWQMQKVKGGSNSELFDESKAFMLGNLFKSLYLPYKGFTNYPIQSMTNRQQKLQKLQMHEFSAHEANLYLDNYPNDNEMLKLFNKHNEQAKIAREEFEKEFGPLTVSDADNDQKWEWVSHPWPWEKQ